VQHKSKKQSILLVQSCNICEFNCISNGRLRMNKKNISKNYDHNLNFYFMPQRLTRSKINTRAIASLWYNAVIIQIILNSGVKLGVTLIVTNPVTIRLSSANVKRKMQDLLCRGVVRKLQLTQLKHIRTDVSDDACKNTWLSISLTEIMFLSLSKLHKKSTSTFKRKIGRISWQRIKNFVFVLMRTVIFPIQH